MFSGAKLAFFSLGRMRLEAEAEKGSKSAAKVLRLRMDSNLLLCTILWGNVSSNVLLSLLSESVFAGLGGFLFSTIGITFFGEIIPQAYFSRHALRVGALLSPVMRFYQILPFPGIFGSIRSLESIINIREFLPPRCLLSLKPASIRNLLKCWGMI
ncbi:CNNM domain-containing protein [Akkermansiaceae bacterium]|nr:CNNM domain-containing protein [Akkermansiaceae bacterium]MDB4323161.1 CNNM domain-containing protein [Akkermansiaceae bacterium]